jgi:Fatty acid hydroxylase superfamily
MTILHFAISAGLAYPVLSLMEYIIHRHLMHKNASAKFLQNSYLADTFRNHAIIHHGRCYAIFDEEKSSCAEIDIRVKPLTMLTVMALPCLSIFFLDPIASLVLFAGGIINGTLWSEIHDEMHRPTGAWFCNIRAYRYLKRRHYLHHRHPNTNFNTLFPMWDWVFGTTSVETDDDRLEMDSATWRVRSATRPNRSSQAHPQAS